MTAGIPSTDIGDPQDLHDLRVAVISIDKHQTAITGALKGVIETLTLMREDMGNLRKQVHEGAKTNWPVLIASGGMVLSVIVIFGGLVAWMYSFNINRSEGDVRDLASIIGEHTRGDQSERLLERVEANTNLITALRSDYGLLVPRSEHETRWDADRDRDQANTEQIKHLAAEAERARDADERRTTQELSRVELAITDRLNRLEGALESGLYSGLAR